LPLAFVRHVIDHEWVQTLADLVERRLMLLYHPRLTRRCLEQLADLLTAAGKLDAQQASHPVHAFAQRLREHYGKTVV
jgi:glycerol-3-phosphate dehydrogenase